MSKASGLCVSRPSLVIFCIWPIMTETTRYQNRTVKILHTTPIQSTIIRIDLLSALQSFFKKPFTLTDCITFTKMRHLFKIYKTFTKMRHLLKQIPLIFKYLVTPYAAEVWWELWLVTSGLNVDSVFVSSFLNHTPQHEEK